jgi:hypothetical protein
MSSNRAGDPPDRAAASNPARLDGPRKESAGVVTPPSGPRPGSLDPTIPFVRPGSSDPIKPKKGSNAPRVGSHDEPTTSDTGDRTDADARVSSGRSKMPAFIGKYQILEKVGRGGMGVLYRGVDPVLDREVAVKLMLGDFSDGDSQLRARFYREARSAAKLQHRNIVTIFEFA